MHLTDVNGSDIPDDVIKAVNVVVRLGKQTLYADIDKKRNRHSSQIDYVTHGLFHMSPVNRMRLERFRKQNSARFTDKNRPPFSLWA